MLELEQYINGSIFDFFEIRISGLGVESQAVYRRAVKSLDGFLAGHHLQLSELSETMVLDWAAELMAEGLSFNSAVQFVDVLSSLVNSAVKEGILKATDAVKTAKARILAHRSVPVTDSNPNVLGKLLALLRMSATALGEGAKYRDLLLFSLLNGATPLMETAMLKKTELNSYSEASNAVAEHNLGQSRRKYVFDLGQSALTPRQLREEVYDNILRLMRRFVNPHIESVDDALYSFWVLLALKCGTTSSVAMGCVPPHTDLYQPGFVKRGNADDSTRQQLADAVAPLILNNPARWYAMRLRRNVKFNEIKAAVKELDKSIELYYPCDVIATKVGKKLVYQNQPFIRDVVFFRTRATEIQPMFREIGDRAWCYRLNSTPGAPYAVIPQSQFRDFQAAVGQFTEETEILPLDVPAADDEVVVIGSMWGERKGKFDRPVTDKTGKLLYRVVLSPDSGFAFRIDVDPRTVKTV